MPEATDGLAPASALDPVAQAGQIFSTGCGLPAAWSHAPQWRIFDGFFGQGLHFLLSWAAWKADPARPAVLHYVGLHSHTAPALAAWPEAWPVSWQPLAQALAQQCWGLLPGIHRLSFEQGQVLLTLWIDTPTVALRRQAMTADSIFLHGPQWCDWPLDSFKSLARHCRRGTRLASDRIPEHVPQALRQQGFALKEAQAAPALTGLQAVFDPAWQPRLRAGSAHVPRDSAGVCLVIGAGLAGAAAATSLARRGWDVTVMDCASSPASGASGLPAGLFCPHVSPDDSVLSRLSRAGVRQTLWQLQRLQQQDLLGEQDWAHSGVLERGIEAPPRLPEAWHSVDGSEALWPAGQDWSERASAAQRKAAGLDTHGSADDCWHQQAGWVRPARLIGALLARPGLHWRPAAAVAQVQRHANGQWQALDTRGQVLAQAELVVVAAGPASQGLWAGAAHTQWPLQTIRGQISWQAHDKHSQQVLPPFPVNGHGNLVPHFPADTGAGATASHWAMGSTFERDINSLPPSLAEQQQAHASNGDKLRSLLPASHAALADFFAAPAAATWSQLRCTAPDRLPLVGPVDANLPGLWTLTALGSRGLTLALLCAELLAARLHGEPLPLDARLAAALGTERLQA